MQSSPENNDSPLGRVCRLCHRGDEAMRLMRLCSCKYLVHKPCLETRLRDTGVGTCALCGDAFNLLWTPRFGLARGFWLWVTTRADTNLMLMMLVYVAMMTPSVVVSACTVRAMLRNSREAATLRSSGEYWLELVHDHAPPVWMAVLSWMMIAAYAGLVVTCAAVYLELFRRWYGTTFTVTVLDPPPGQQL